MIASTAAWYATCSVRADADRADGDRLPGAGRLLAEPAHISIASPDAHAAENSRRVMGVRIW